MITHTKTILATLTTGAAVALLATQTAWSKPKGGANKLAGSWVAKATTNPVQATYSLIPDPSGHHASIIGSLQVQIPASGTPGSPVPGADVLSPTFTGEAVMTGPDTATYSVVGYGVNTGVPFAGIAFIWVDSGEIEFLPSGQTQVTHHVAYYLPEADANNDGLPDDGQDPVLCLSTVTLDTRIGVRAPCAP